MKINLAFTHFFAILFLAMLLTACTKEMTPEDLQAKLVQANGNIKSYAVGMTMSTHLQAVAYDQPMDVVMSMVSTGRVDRTAKRLQMQSTIKSDVTGMKTELETQTFVTDNMLYTQVLGTWLKMSLPEGMWQQQDRMYDTISLINSGTIERLPDEVVDGNEYYVVNIKPDIKKVAEIALQDQTEFAQSNLNYSDMVKAYTVKAWVNKKTFVVERSVTDTTLVLTAQNMGNDTRVGEGNITMDIRIELKISDLNVPVDIQLPEKAKDATLIEKKSTNMVTGNVIKSMFN